MAESTPIRVAVAGAKGRMGREVIRMIAQTSDLVLVGAIDVSRLGEDAGVVAGVAPLGVALEDDPQHVLSTQKPEVLVDFTNPQAVIRNVDIAIANGVSPVIGTTGLTNDEIQRFDHACRQQGIGGFACPNFSLGAVLLMRFAQQAARYLPDVEIIEMHHDQKRDAPSGTALRLAELIAEAREPHVQGHPDAFEKLDGARGATYEGMHIHSVRLPGYVAHHEVLFGGHGQVLSLRHDSLSREDFMPGVHLAIQKVRSWIGFVYGLENIVD